MPPSRSLLALALAGSLFLACALTPAVADDLSGYSVMLQRGDTRAPGAIEIAPNGQWFLSATPPSIYLSDLKTGAVLREITTDASRRLTQVAISQDGSAIFAKYAADDGTEPIQGWRSDSGRPIDRAAAAPPPADSPRWNWVEHSWMEDPFRSPKTYLADQKIDHLVDPNRVERVEATNRRNVVQVTVAGEISDIDDDFTRYHYYFIDLVRKQIVAELAGSTLHTFCGQPHGAFAFDGRYLVVAPTELDASSSFINAIAVDTKAGPAAVQWSRPCRDYMVAGLGIARGLIVVTPSPDKATIWDPATARQVARLADIHDSDVLTWSRDRTTFATGFHEQRTVQDEHTFGVDLLRSGERRFFPTTKKILEIRLAPDGSIVFARTEAGWTARDTSSGRALSSYDLPAAEEEEMEPTDSGDVASPDGRYRIVNYRQLVEAATGRVLIGPVRFLHFIDGGRHVSSLTDLDTVTMWDTASGQKLWTATGNDTLNEDFLVMQFPDGRVRLSEGAEGLVKLVRGFDVLPFDAAAKRTLLRP